MTHNSGNVLGLIFFVWSASTFYANSQVVQDSIPQSRTQPVDSAFVMSKSPGGAALRSAIIPGWGQLYNQSYWKIPVIIGVAGYLAYGWISDNKLFVDYRERYAASITPTSPSGNLTLKLYREFYRDRRDTYAWFFGLLYLLQIADAYVDAHLYDFSVSDEVRASIFFAQHAQLTFTLRW